MLYPFDCDGLAGVCGYENFFHLFLFLYMLDVIDVASSQSCLLRSSFNAISFTCLKYMFCLQLRHTTYEKKMVHQIPPVSGPVQVERRLTCTPTCMSSSRFHFL